MTDNIRFNALVTMYKDDGTDNGGVRLKVKEVTLEAMIKGFLAKMSRWLYTTSYNIESWRTIKENKWEATITCCGYTFHLVAEESIVKQPSWYQE